MIDQIIDWNVDRHNKDYDPTKEYAMLQEEVTEYAHSYIKTVSDEVGVDILTYTTEDEEESKQLNDRIALFVESPEFKPKWEVNQADALADTIFVAVGSLYKLTGSRAKVQKILQAVVTANNQKGSEKDENGKIIKPASFVPPEEKIHDILYPTVEDSDLVDWKWITEGERP